MNTIPVFSSILSPEHIAGFVKEKYGLDGSVTARILKTGISHTYLIISGADQFIFRIYTLNWRTEKEIAEEIRLLNLLKENNIPVSYPLADASSNYIQSLNAPEGTRYAVLFSFAKGKKLLNIPADLHYTLGQIMAKIHAVTNNLPIERVSYTPEVLLVDSFEKLKNFLPVDTEEMLYMQSLQTYLHETFSNAETERLRKGVVHLDIWFDNFVISNNKDVTLFDFDFCGNGLLMLDIAYYVLQLYSTEKDVQELNLKKQKFFDGYESITTISKEEKALIPAAGAAIYFFYLGVQCSRYNDWSNTFLNEIYLKRFINLLIKKWVDAYELQLK